MLEYCNYFCLEAISKYGISFTPLGFLTHLGSLTRLVEVLMNEVMCPFVSPSQAGRCVTKCELCVMS